MIKAYNPPFADKPVPQDVLYTVLEAARWAPSSNHLQPWRFHIAQTEVERELFKEFFSLAAPGRTGPILYSFGTSFIL
ncbi:nitroreductase family protein [Paenibacillus provencensis]|uniref:Nitroreductase family protein n=1 Tax=Paenibacillus provencensis TaxID=441151 RepID=A0ABW3QHL1_9BACL